MRLPHPIPATALQAFQAPAIPARPKLRWWWPGGAVEPEALCAQLRAIADGGFGGVEIQPFRVGLPSPLPAAAEPMLHEVFTPRWFDTVGRVMDEAEQLGLTVDVTFGSAWPFGGGETVTPELAATELTLAWTTVQGPAAWQGKPHVPARPQRTATWLAHEGGVDPAQALPEGWAERMAAREQTVAVLAVRGGVPSLGPYAAFVPMTLPDPWGQVHAAGWIDSARTIDLTDRVQADGTLAWEVPEGEWQIVVLRRFVSDQCIADGAGRGPQLVIDHLNQAAFDAHAARVGEPALPAWGRHAGRTWRSVFIDSLELPADLHWSDDFDAEFERRRGYALRPFLPLLLHPGWRNCFQARSGAPLFDDADAGPRVRADYRLTISELMLERLYAPFCDWATGRGLAAKVQAHGAPVDWLQAYGLAGIPETEDLAAGAAPHFLRVARSAAHLWGRPVVSAEAFCWLIEGLAVTPQKLRERADTFYANGVQELIGHGASAPLLGAAEGDAWYPWQQLEFGTQIDPANPLWPMLRPLADYMARCQTLLQRGSALVPVAVLAPLDLFGFMGAGDRLTAPPWHDALQDAGYDWDWINETGLGRCRLDGAELVSPSGQRYGAVLLPDLPALRVALAERLAEIAEAGVAVWALGSAPQREEGWLDAAVRDRRVQAAMHRALRGGERVAPPSAIGRLLREIGVAPALALPLGHGLQFVRREEAGQGWLFLRNPGLAERRPSLALAAGQVAELWDAWTGEIRRLPASPEGNVAFSLAPGGAVMLRLAESGGEALADEPVPAAPHTIDRTVAGPWQVQATGRGLRGRAIAFEAQWADLHDVSHLAEVADFAGEIRYATTFRLSEAELASRPLCIDLGRVGDAVRVGLDGAAPCTLTEPPFVFELPARASAGEHRLELTVANRAENAMRDPQRPGGLPLPGRRTERLPTGLLGPVRLCSAVPGARRWRLA